MDSDLELDKRDYYFETGANYNCFDFFSGGNGYLNDYATGRILRDAKIYEIRGGTSEIRLIIGRAINAEYS